jgi:hypothetical protein
MTLEVPVQPAPWKATSQISASPLRPCPEGTSRSAASVCSWRSLTPSTHWTLENPNPFAVSTVCVTDRAPK